MELSNPRTFYVFPYPRFLILSIRDTQASKGSYIPLQVRNGQYGEGDCLGTLHRESMKSNPQYPRYTT